MLIETNETYMTKDRKPVKIVAKSGYKWLGQTVTYKADNGMVYNADGSVVNVDDHPHALVRPLDLGDLFIHLVTCGLWLNRSSAPQSNHQIA